MKLAKKMLVCVLALALTLACGVVAFAGTATATLTATANDGVVTVTVGLKDASEVETCELFVSYDSNVLEFVESTLGDAQGLTIAQGNVPADSQLSCSAMALDTFSGTASLAVYTLRVKDGVSAESTTLSFVESSVDDDAATATVTVTLASETTKKADVTTAKPAATTKKADATTKKADSKVTTTVKAAGTTAKAAATTAAGKATSKITKTGEAGVAVIAGVSALAAVAFVVTKKK